MSELNEKLKHMAILPLLRLIVELLVDIGKKLDDLKEDRNG